MLTKEYRNIYLAGGCFWGVEAYMSKLKGVVDVTSGYANGNTVDPTYKQVCSGETGYAETVHVTYDPKQIPLERILRHYFKIIDPTSLNRQGNDVGTQYRTGIYYEDANDLKVIRYLMNHEQAQYDKPLVVEVAQLKQYYLAEDYHQDYLEKNPKGYCHIGFSTLNELLDEAIIYPEDYSKPDVETLKKTLTPIAYHVTQENGTERPFQNEYWNTQQPGIYVDRVTGEPLFTSLDKFDSSCGWPSFSSPIIKEVIEFKEDYTHDMTRVEVRSRVGDSHLGHVFEDGPEEKGGLRFCINSASLRFIPLEDMESEGYGGLIYLF